MEVEVVPTMPDVGSAMTGYRNKTYRTVKEDISGGIKELDSFSSLSMRVLIEEFGEGQLEKKLRQAQCQHEQFAQDSKGRSRC